MDKQETVKALLQQIAFCDNWQSGELYELQRKALQYYMCNARGDEVEGCSSVQSADVADMLEAVTAGIMPAFSTQRIIEFEPYNIEDETRARQESDAVNYVIMGQNHGYTMLQSAIRDALLLRNGFTKVYLDEKHYSQRRDFIGIDDELAPFLLNAQEPGWSRRPVSIEDGEKEGTKDLIFEDTRTEYRVKVTSVDPCRMYMTAGFDGDDIQDIPFIAELCYYQRGDLIDMGYSATKVNDLAKTDMVPDSTNTGEVERNHGLTALQDAAEKAQEWIRCYHCYWRVENDDGGLSLEHIFLADKTILEQEPYDFIPYATGTPIIVPHRLIGLGLYDKLKEVQDIKTATLRQYLDCFQNGNLGRVGYLKGAVNTDHLLNPRPSGAVECMSPQAVWPLPNTDIGPSAQALLDYMDKVRSARGGASLDLQSAEAQVMGETAQGIERQYSVREQFAAMMARTLAETLIAGTYLNTHRALRHWYGESGMTYKTSQGFQNTNPQDWPERFRVNVVGGLSAGEQRAVQQGLAGVMQQQTMMLQNGLTGITTSLQGAYKACIDWARTFGLDNPEQYFIDPASQEAQLAAQQQAQQAQQQQQQAAQLQGALLEVEQGKLALQRYISDSEMRFKYYEAHLDSEIELAKIAGHAETQMVLERQKAALNSDNYRKGE